MSRRESLIGQISDERKRREAHAARPATSVLDDGAVAEAFEALMYFTPPDQFAARLDTTLAAIEDGIPHADTETRVAGLGFLVDLAIGLASFLPRWNLRNRDRHGSRSLTETDLQSLANKALDAATRLGVREPGAAARLLEQWRAHTTARFEAEQAPDAPAEARSFVGGSIRELVANSRAAIAASNLRRIAEMRDEGETLTEISNDYAAFLPYAMWVGASFATTNPPLVDYAWLADRARWDPVADQIIGNRPEASPDELARLMTAEVVLANMRLLRPVFLLTDGAMGCVCLQVNPHKHADARAMVDDARYFYALLRDRLGGGVPNVVFKLPGTQGGLVACRMLTSEGIGVTITVNFGLFQHVPFAEAMAEGEALFACLVEMNGRLAYPVRDELLANLPALAEYGIDEPSAREAAAWAGVAVVKRAYELLRERRYDVRCFKPLVASLRIYEGPEYAALPSAFPDMTEILGATILSVFPNVRRAFDAVGQIRLTAMQIEEPIPDRILEVLSHSEVFKQAYYVYDPAWMRDDDGRFRPQHPLSLDQEHAVFAWPPVHNTMSQFQDAYDGFVQRILARKRLSHE